MKGDKHERSLAMVTNKIKITRTNPKKREEL